MRLLYVDDSARNREIISSILAPAHIDLDIVTNGQEGLAKIEETTYSLILLDLHMPEMSGLDILERIRARQDAKATTPVMILTADASIHTRDTCMEAGADAFILKPIELHSFYAALNRLIARENMSHFGSAA